MELMVAGLGPNIGWIKGIQLDVVDHWIHPIGGFVCIGIILVPHPGDEIPFITIIIIIGGVSTFMRSSRNSSHLHSMQR